MRLFIVSCIAILLVCSAVYGSPKKKSFQYDDDGNRITVLEFEYKDVDPGQLHKEIKESYPNLVGVSVETDNKNHKKDKVIVKMMMPDTPPSVENRLEKFIKDHVKKPKKDYKDLWKKAQTTEERLAILGELLGLE